MAPKVQKGGKTAASNVAFAYNQQQKVPSPQPLHPLLRRTQQTILCCRGSLLVLGVDSNNKLTCDVLAKKTLEPEAVVLSFQNDERRPQGTVQAATASSGSSSVNVEDLRVTSIMAQAGKSLALINTESHGLVIAGFFDGEEAGDDEGDDAGNFAVVKQLVPLRFAHLIPGSVLTASAVVTSIAVAKSFCLAVVLDIGTGTARVAGRGFTSTGALGKAPARSGSSATAALATMANVTFPKNASLPQQQFSAWEDSFASFRWLTELDVLCVTTVYGGNSLALFNTTHGLYAMGKFHDQATYEGPTLVLEWARPGTVPLSIAFTDTAAYCLLEENTLYSLSPSSRVFEKSLLLQGLQENVSSLRAGAEHVVAIGEKTHNLFGWGNAAFGQLGPSNGPCVVQSPSLIKLPPAQSGESLVAVHCLGFRTFLSLHHDGGEGSEETPSRRTACCYRILGKV